MDTFNTRAFARYGTYTTSRTGLLLVDPYNDFLHPDGKSYFKSKEVIEGVKLLENMTRVIQTARELQIKIFYVPIGTASSYPHLFFRCVQSHRPVNPACTLGTECKSHQ